MLAGRQLGHNDPFSGSPGWRKRYGEEEVSQFRAAQMIAEKWNVTRREMEEFALESNRRAIQAIEQGYFKREIAPYGSITQDETPRYGSTLEKMAALEPVSPGGSAALLIASEAAVRRYKLKPRARIHHMSVRGANPVWMLTAPIPATQYALEKAGLELSQIDLVEINEAFASVVLSWAKDLHADLSKVNVNGGAIALGHPLGATGARLMTTLLHELERRGGRYGLQTMCEGGGQANVTIIERLS
jgi:acetyl-CoA C-acetyltransferase